jgi:4-hydroxybenzoate polyprenyltransferase
MNLIKNETKLLSILINEVYLFHRFCRSNYDATIFAILCIAIPSCIRQNSEQIPLDTILVHFIITMLGIALYIYQFDLSNQIHGVEEDRENKPDRPIPSNLISVQGAQFRWYVVSLAYVLFGWYFGILHLSLTWQLLSYVNNVLNWSKNWIWKNFCLGPGTFIIVSAHYMLMKGTTLTDYEILWCIFLSIVVTINVHIQDYRDVEGDLKNGRKTFPMLFKTETIARRISCAIILTTAFVPKLFIDNGSRLSKYYCMFHFLIFVIMGYRVVQERGRKYDHLTYEVLCTWFCISLVFMVFIV